MESLGIIAGSGQFPFLVAKGAKLRGARVVACGFTDTTDLELANYVDSFKILPLGKLSALISFFHKENVSKVCMAGAVNKPKAINLKPDFRTAKLLFFAIKNKGDDSILRAVANELEKEGLTVVRPDFFAPDLLGKAGLLTKYKPNRQALHDIEIGKSVIQALSPFDVGQCVSVKKGAIVGIEAIEGTDASIIRSGELSGKGCTLVKMTKKGQDERLDLPSIGLKTIELMSKYNYSCLAYEAEKTLFFDQEESIRLANKCKISIIGIRRD